MDNRQEYLASTRPDDPTSFLRFEWIERTAGGVTLQFRAAPGRSYTVRYKNDLSEPSWQKLTDVPAPDAFLDRVLTDPAASAARFYRLVSPAQ